VRRTLKPSRMLTDSVERVTIYSDITMALINDDQFSVRLSIHKPTALIIMRHHSRFA
jgi:hypothetical protein